jgi:hypothetical protein
MKLINKRKLERDTLRDLSAEGPILVIIEEDVYLGDSYRYAAHTILLRKRNSFVIQKSRDHVTTHYALASYYNIRYQTDNGKLDFMETVDKMYSSFANIVIVDGDFITLKSSDLPLPKGLSDWYFQRRGFFTGKKFGL